MTHGTHIDPAQTPEWEGDLTAEEAVVTPVATYTPGESCRFDTSILDLGDFSSYFEAEGDGVDEQGGDPLVFLTADPQFAAGCCGLGFDVDPSVEDGYWQVTSAEYGQQTQDFTFGIKVRLHELGTAMTLGSVSISNEGSTGGFAITVDAAGVVHGFFTPVNFPGSEIEIQGGSLPADSTMRAAVLTGAISGGVLTLKLYVESVLVDSDTIATDDFFDGSGAYSIGTTLYGVADQPVFLRGYAWTQTEVDEYDGCGTPAQLDFSYNVDVQKEHLDVEYLEP